MGLSMDLSPFSGHSGQASRGGWAAGWALALAPAQHTRLVNVGPIPTSGCPGHLQLAQ